MIPTLSLCLALPAACPAGAVGAVPAEQELQEANAAAVERVELRARNLRNFDLLLPSDPWRAVGAELPIPHAGGSGFAVQPEGVGLRIDTDGDGTPERLVEGVVDATTGERSAWVVLGAERADGSPFQYAVRLLDAGEGWHWAASGVVQGKLGKLKVQLIDLSGNGRYDDFGEDAIVLGSGRIASLLSRALHEGGELVSLAVDPHGASLELRAFEGPTGTLDVIGGLTAEAKLLSAVVANTQDPTLAFDLARSGGAAALPAGEYRIVSGMLGLGEGRVRVLPGRSKPIAVPAAGEAALRWGGPVRAEFGYARRGPEVVFDPAAVWTYGAAGEEYAGWNPRGKSPRFTVKERKAGTELASAVFPGST